MRDPKTVTDLESITTYEEALRVFFSRPGPRRIAKTAGAALLARAFLGPPSPGELATCVGVAAWWPLQEWLTHKYLLHLKPRDGFDLYFAQRHRWHHEHPRDVDGTLLPMRVLRGSTPVVGGLFLLALGPRRRTLSAMATYTTMTLLYEWTHFLVHTGIQPKGAFYTTLRRNHRLHHFRSEQYWYAFTLPLVDTVLGTNPDPAKIARSKTAMDLHGLRAEEERRAEG